jgi:tryptophan synthase beta chain
MAKKEIPYKIYLEESEMPKYWYNLRADMVNKPAPLLDAKTHEPMTAKDLAPVFCDDLNQEAIQD